MPRSSPPSPFASLFPPTLELRFAMIGTGTNGPGATGSPPSGCASRAARRGFAGTGTPAPTRAPSDFGTAPGMPSARADSRARRTRRPRASSTWSRFASTGATGTGRGAVGTPESNMLEQTAGIDGVAHRSVPPQQGDRTASPDRCGLLPYPSVHASAQRRYCVGIQGDRPWLCHEGRLL